MARLQVEIGGTTQGLGQAATQALGILQNLQNTADNLKLELFKATDVATLNATGGALTIVTSKIKEYTDAAIRGSAAFQDQKTGVILESLSTRLSVLTGNANLFGESVKNQKQQISAYENAISKLLANGIDPLDSRVVSLKKSIDQLNSSFESNKQKDFLAQFQQTGRIIPDLENKIKNLKTALSGATNERSIVQYNIRLKEAQNELTRLKALGINTGAALTSSATTAANAARKLSGGYNAVGLEFGRIIQDAPFAANNFGAIGNNITRLVEVIPQYVSQTRAAIIAQGGVATSAAVAKASLLGLVTGFGGVTIAISAIVSAFTFYQQHQQAVKRETDKLSGANVDYIDTLHGVEKAQLQGTKSAQEDLITARILFKAYTDANKPLKDRKAAYEQLQQLYPDYFQNLVFEETASKKTKAAYDELTGSLLATGRARAGVNIITKNSERQLENESKAAKLQLQIDKQSLLVAKDRAALGTVRAAGSAGPGAGQQGAAKALADSQQKLNELTHQLNIFKTDSRLLGEQNLEVEKKVNIELERGGRLVDAKNKKAAKGPTYHDAITPKAKSLSDDADLAGLRGVDLELAKVQQKYFNLYDAIEEESKKKGANLSRLAKQRTQAEADFGHEVTQIIIAEQLRVASEIERINNESGVKAAENRAKDIANIEKWYAIQVEKAQGNAEILVAIEAGKQTQIDAVDEKYRAKRLAAQEKLAQQRKDAEAKIADGITTITEKTFRTNLNGTKKARLAIEEDLRLRLKAVQKYFDDLRMMYASDPLMQQLINKTQSTVNQNLTSDANAAKAGDFGSKLAKATKKFGDDFYNIISNISRQADETFGQVAARLGISLFDSLSTTINDVFANEFRDLFSAAISDASVNLSKGLKGAIAGAGLLGGAISGLTPKTSGVGQGIGGALTGAATGAGAAIGIGAALGAAAGPVGIALGAVGGAIVGALKGIFGAKKARKQEELQKQQLAEQQKQTKLMERQNALAYTASIIGRMTTNGVVTGVEVNAFGQLTTKISGQDMLVVLDRASRSRKRGV